MNRLWVLQILYWRPLGLHLASLFMKLFRDNPMMPVLDMYSVQTLESSTSCGSEPMAYDNLVILRHGHIGSLCVSNLTPIHSLVHSLALSPSFQVLVMICISVPDLISFATTTCRQLI